MEFLEKWGWNPSNISLLSGRIWRDILSEETIQKIKVEKDWLHSR